MIKTNLKEKLHKKTTKIEASINIINKLYRDKDVKGLLRFIKQKSIDVVVESLDEIDDIQITLFVLIATKDKECGEIFKYLSDSKREDVISGATFQQLKIIVNEMWPDEVLDLSDELPQYFKSILLALDSDMRVAVKKIAKFTEDEAGSVMNPDFMTLREKWTVKEAIIEIKRNRDEYEPQMIYYVTDDEGVLKGSLTVSEIFFADDFNDTIENISNVRQTAVKANDELVEVIDIFEKYQCESLPVVDEENKVVGYISDNDILPAISEEATEDIYNMYGITDLQFPYMKSSIWSIAKSRLLWLIILMISATLTTIVIDQFQQLGYVLTAGLSTIVLIPILPVISGSSGNAGAQSSASVIRALSVGEVTDKEYTKIVWKEFRVGLLVGLILCLVNFVRLTIYFAIFNPDMQPAIDAGAKIMQNITPFEVGLIGAASSSIALWIAIVLSKLVGGILPLVAMKINVDPTVMAMPVLSTLLDATTTTILFGLGIGILQIIIV